MKFSKKAFLVVTTLATAVLAGCTNQSNIITFTTPATSSTFNTNNQTAAVSVTTQDLRPSREVANYTKRGEVIRLTASPEITSLFQQAVQQDLNAKGFQVINGAANAHITVNVKKFFATVEQGNLMYKSTADVSVDVAVQGAKGNFNKTFNASRSYEGAFGAGNKEIQKILTQAFQDVVQAIYNDNEVGNAIHQYK